MNKLVSKRLVLIIPVVLISFYIVSCMSLKKEEDPILKANDTTIKSGEGFIEPSEPCVPTVSYNRHVTLQYIASSNTYYIDYVPSIGGDCEMEIGCDHIDLVNDPEKPDAFDCFRPVGEYPFSAEVIDCNYIKVISFAPNPLAHPVHTIDFRVRRVEGTQEYISNWGMITLHIENLFYPPVYQTIPNCWISN